MPRALPDSFASVYAVVSQDTLRQLGDTLSAQAGPPTSIDVDPVSEAGRVAAWNTPHPEATDQAMQQLAVQKYAEHTRAGMSPQDAETATAEDLTHFRYRARMPLYTQGTVSWAEQVREAEALARAAAKAAPPEPPVPAPSGMPYLPPGQQPAASTVPLGPPTAPPGGPGPAPGMPAGGSPPSMPGTGMPLPAPTAAPGPGPLPLE